VAIGLSATSSFGNSVALGASSRTTVGAQSGYAGYAVGSTNSVGEIGVGTAAGDRKITGVAAGSAGNDAVNVSQLNAVGNELAGALGAGANFNSTTGVFTAPSYVVGGVTYNTVEDALNNISSGTGGGGSPYFSASGPGAGARASGSNSVAIGSGAVASATNSVALGSGATTDVGALSNYTGFGLNHTSSSVGEVSVGSAGAERQLTNVAPGVADTDAANVEQLKSVYASAVKYEKNADGSVNYNSVSLGDGQSSGPVTLHNVAAGVQATDATNLGQVQELINASTAGQSKKFADMKRYVDREIDKAVDMARKGPALALATAGLRYDERPGRTSVAFGVGAYEGVAGAALGLGYTSRSGNWRTNIAGSSTGSDWGVSAGIGYSWGGVENNPGGKATYYAPVRGDRSK